jgi:AraC-like DNA-binding protein
MLRGMVHLSARPRVPALRPFVKSIHYHEGAFPFGLERILPNGQAHLMINLAEDEFRTYSGEFGQSKRSYRGAALAGPHARPTILDTAEFQWLASVEFHPGGAAAFLPLPVDEVSDQAVGLDDLWKLEGRLLREQILEALTPQDKINAIESSLLRNLRGTSSAAMYHAVAMLNRGVPVAVSGSRLGLLPKTFVRRFREQVGLTPKRFARVRRMQRIIRSLRTCDAVDWSLLAVDYGFSDQAHLIHDFRDLTGITPMAYKPHSPQRGNHVPIPSQAG